MKLPRRCVTHCGSSSLPLYPSISKEIWAEDRQSLREESYQIWSLPSISLAPTPRRVPAIPFSSLAEGPRRVLPPAESLTNVALKCNEVWNGSCGDYDPRTAAVTAVISLSLTITMSCEGRETETDGAMGWRAVIQQSVRGKQTSNAFVDGFEFTVSDRERILMIYV